MEIGININKARLKTIVDELLEESVVDYPNVPKEIIRTEIENIVKKRMIKLKKQFPWAFNWIELKRKKC